MESGQGHLKVNKVQEIGRLCFSQHKSQHEKRRYNQHIFWGNNNDQPIVIGTFTPLTTTDNFKL